ncbi:tcpH (nucleomorph) [Hemiselmis andersenii]|uniref:CCT-eta n=1 Tax=Hemiselmis andersenii TaxID=464988 RepID=A9BK47_HEMAN|nr:tcpH [Hemiselmis andersenii]ABW97880.1 tcpH [Hemiselmis andersenii]|mmetsp:Transcript_27012/g.65706  ORF Transcript_27012/g.65706 Transcript_27012/m.65706 type:complete len:527 (-) Transcript_27012:821-2401(-)
MLEPSSFFLKNLGQDLSSVSKVLFNIKECLKITETIKTTLGPSSMDKFIQYEKDKTMITNDGATIMNLIKPKNEVSKILIEIAKSQDFEVGDGTTTVCLICGELLMLSKELLEEKIHPRDISKIFKKGALIASQIIKEVSIEPPFLDIKLLKKILMSCCATSLNSKLISGKRHIFSEIIVSTCLIMGKEFDPNMISVKSVLGGANNDSFFIKGICLKKPFSYAGYEKQTKKHYFPQILLLNIELEIKNEEKDGEAKLKSMKNYKKFIDAEWSIIYEKLDRISETKVKAVFSTQAIGDLATQYFAERSVICGGRISSDDITRISKGTGARFVSSIANVSKFVTGKCGILEEKPIGRERFIFILGCSNKSITIMLRGSSIKLLEETKRCLNDGIMVVRRVLKNQSVVAGAGAIEMKIASKLRKYMKAITGKNQIILKKFAQALEIIPKTICENGGLDSITILSNLRSIHESSDCWEGINVEKGTIFNAFDNFIWEPVLIKINAIQAATEAACLILSIDSCFSFINEKE